MKRQWNFYQEYFSNIASKTLIKNVCRKVGCLYPFNAACLFLYPLKPQKTRCFLVFSMGVEREQWNEMGNSAQKMKFSIKDFSGKCDQMRILRNWTHLLELWKWIIWNLAHSCNKFNWIWMQVYFLVINYGQLFYEIKL